MRGTFLTASLEACAPTRTIWPCEMPALAPSDQFFYYVDAKAPFELQHLPPNVTVRTLAWTIGVEHGRQRRPPGAVDGDATASTSRTFPANYGPRGDYALVVTVHDALNLFRMSEHWRGFGKRPRQVALMAYLGWKTRRALSHADLRPHHQRARSRGDSRAGAAAPSSGSRHSRGGWRGVQADSPIRERCEDARQRLLRRPLTILADGIKNPAAVIEAFVRCRTRGGADTELLFFSREPVPRGRLSPPPCADPGVRFLARPATDDLVLLMNLATVFVFPSWYEGFGLPLVEAMSVRGARDRVGSGVDSRGAGRRRACCSIWRTRPTLGRHLPAVLESEALRRELRETEPQARRGTSRGGRRPRRTLDVYRERRRAPARGRTAMNILYVSDSTTVSGAEVVLLGLPRPFQAARVPLPRVPASRPTRACRPELDGRKIAWTATNGYSRILLETRAQPGGPRPLRRVVLRGSRRDAAGHPRDSGIDLVHSISYPASLYAAVSRRWGWQSHSSGTSTTSSGSTGVNRHLYRFVAAIVSPPSSVRRTPSPSNLARAGIARRKLRTVYNGIDLGRFDVDDQDVIAACRRELGLGRCREGRRPVRPDAALQGASHADRGGTGDPAAAAGGPLLLRRRAGEPALPGANCSAASTRRASRTAFRFSAGAATSRSCFARWTSLTRAHHDARAGRARA